MKPRLIARLDLKGPNLIKGIHLEGLRILGDPQDFAQQYYKDGIEELIFIDLVASLYGRNKLVDIIKRTIKDIFIPLTAGGGIRSLQDVNDLLRAGADKIAINTAAINNPNLVEEIAKEFGSQCMVLSIEAKQIGLNKWTPLTETGRETTGLDVCEWSKRAENLGAGEILLTSIDKEGTSDGFDINLIESVANSVNIPIISSGGFGSVSDYDAAISSGASAIAVADALHYKKITVQDLIMHRSSTKI
jgi:imidazole glycerol-phosphate synthase subunit HisF